MNGSRPKLKSRMRGWDTRPVGDRPRVHFLRQNNYPFHHTVCGLEIDTREEDLKDVATNKPEIVSCKECRA
jgi:hypothetical protein